MTFRKTLTGIALCLFVSLSGCDESSTQVFIEQFPELTREQAEALAEKCTLLPDGMGLECNGEQP